MLCSFLIFSIITTYQIAFIKLQIFMSSADTVSGDTTSKPKSKPRGDIINYLLKL